jgi:hypothetical protein
VKRTFGFLAAAGVFAVALTLALAACGGGSGDSGDGVASLGGQGSGGTGTTANGSKDPQEAAIEYAQCMREQGVDMPDPGANGELQLQVGPGNQEKVEQAQKKCGPLLENARPRLSEEQRSAMQDGLLAFAKCMREHGIDFPDPQFGEGGKVTQRDVRGGIDPDDPKFQEAQEACQPIMDEARRKAGLPENPGGGGFKRSGGKS